MKTQKNSTLANSYRSQAFPHRRGADRQISAPTQKFVVSDARPSPRRGLNRAEASLYIGVSTSKFDELVKDGRMCSPKRIDGRVVWDIRQLDAAFENLPCDGDDAQNPWDEP